MAFLGAMQAAGMVVSIFSAHQQDKLIQLGRTLEQGQFEQNLAALRTSSAQESVAEMVQLRKNLGSQAVAAAAKGNRAGAVQGSLESVSSVASDERTRRMNLLLNENNLRAGNVTSALNLLDSETKLGQNLAKSLFDTVPTTSLFTPNNTAKNVTAKGPISQSLTGGY